MKRILITSTDVMMIQFIVPHIEYLSTKGFLIDVACSNAAGYKNEGYHKQIKDRLPQGSFFYSVNLERNPFSTTILDGYKELKRIIETNRYDLIWTNEPVMSVITRIAAKRAVGNTAKLLYLVHGFHFFKGAPLINWIAYPVEKVMSSFCDALCMINWNDYNFSQRHFAKLPVYHIDGIGLNVEKFHAIEIDRAKKRQELNLAPTDIAVLSVGELQIRKNHIAMIKALGLLNNPRVKYIICGCGELKEYLIKEANNVGLKGRLILLGHRYDIPEILKAVDIFAHPSQREGLGIAAIEAMASGLPIVTSNVQGIPDYSKSGETGFCLEPNDVEGYKNAINYLIEHPEESKAMGLHNIEASKKYDIQNSCKQVEEIINHILS